MLSLLARRRCRLLAKDVGISLTSAWTQETLGGGRLKGATRRLLVRCHSAPRAILHAEGSHPRDGLGVVDSICVSLLSRRQSSSCRATLDRTLSGRPSPLSNVAEDQAGSTARAISASPKSAQHHAMLVICVLFHGLDLQIPSCCSVSEVEQESIIHSRAFSAVLGDELSMHSCLASNTRQTQTLP